MKYAIIVILALLLICVIPVLMFMDAQKRSDTIKIVNMPIFENNLTSRFEVIDQIVFYKGRNGDVPALILKDKETDIKYIYVLGHSSTTLTRLWDK